MTDSASQSLVDLDLLIAVCEKAARSSFAVTIDPVPVLPVVKAAAARITELEATVARIKTQRDSALIDMEKFMNIATDCCDVIGLPRENFAILPSELSRVGDRCANMRSLLVRVHQLGMTAAWKRLPDGSPFSSTPLFGDIEAALDSLPPLAKRGDQERPQIAESRAAEDSETKSAGGEA